MLSNILVKCGISAALGGKSLRRSTLLLTAVLVAIGAAAFARSDRRRGMPLLGLAFFLSGAAALVYQVAWQRILALHTGVGLYSVAMIVAAFMAGLGIGSQLGGRLSSAAFAAARARVLRARRARRSGLFGAASPWLYYDGLYPLRGPVSRATAWQAALAHFVALPAAHARSWAPRLPFLVRAAVRGRPRRALAAIGSLYGVNVLGAAAGALADAVGALPLRSAMRGRRARGAPRRTCVAAAGARARVGCSGPREDSAAAPVEAPPRTPRRRQPPSRALAALYALSGFIALSLEIVWFRLIDVAVKSTAYTFGTVLAVYLLGLGAGAWSAARLASRARASAARLPPDCQCALLALAALPRSRSSSRCRPTGRCSAGSFDYWGDYAFFASRARWPTWRRIVRLYVVLPLALFGLPTLLMGLSFPILQRAVHDDPRTSGRKVGSLQAANIAGCTAGSLLVGLVALERLGTPGTLRCC